MKQRQFDEGKDDGSAIWTAEIIITTAAKSGLQVPAEVNRRHFNDGKDDSIGV